MGNPKGYVPKFLTCDSKVVTPAAENKRHREAKAAKVPTDDEENKRKERRQEALAYVSSLSNALSDVSRDEKASPFMDMAVEEAAEGVVKGEGGPFGAVITQNDKVIARAHNMVLQTNDPTAHAEVVAIRKAASRLGRFDLSDCVLWTSCEPCPMCYGSVFWAKIPICKYAATAQDAAKAGFDDQFIYDSIRNVEGTEEYCKFDHVPHKGAIDVFNANYDMY
jgi:guanine deaminase